MGSLERRCRINKKTRTEKSSASHSPCAWQTRGMKMTKKILPGEQLDEALKKGKSREAHRLSRIRAGRGIGTRRRHLSRLPAKRQGLEERAQTLEQPVDKSGCGGPGIIFSDEVQKMKEKSDPIVVHQNATQKGHRDGKCLQAAVWKLRHWRASVPWSIPTELPKILVSPKRKDPKKKHKHGMGNKPTREGSAIANHQTLLCLTVRSRARCRVRADCMAQRKEPASPREQ